MKAPRWVRDKVANDISRGIRLTVRDKALLKQLQTHNGRRSIHECTKAVGGLESTNEDRLIAMYDNGLVVKSALPDEPGVYALRPTAENFSGRRPVAGYDVFHSPSNRRVAVRVQRAV